MQCSKFFMGTGPHPIGHNSYITHNMSTMLDDYRINIFLIMQRNHLDTNDRNFHLYFTLISTYFLVFQTKIRSMYDTGRKVRTCTLFWKVRMIPQCTIQKNLNKFSTFFTGAVKRFSHPTFYLLETLNFQDWNFIVMVVSKAIVDRKSVV